MIDHYDRSDSVFTEKNLNAYIAATIIQNWDMEAFTDYKGATLHFRDVARRIAKLHILFEESGIKPGDRIAFCGKNSSNWGTACLAAITYGAVVVPILHEFKAENIPFFISPPYQVLMMTCSLLVILNITAVSLFKPNSL